MPLWRLSEISITLISKAHLTFPGKYTHQARNTLQEYQVDVPLTIRCNFEKGLQEVLKLHKRALFKPSQ